MTNNKIRTAEELQAFSKEELVIDLEVTTQLQQNAAEWARDIRNAGGLTPDDYAHLAGSNDVRALAYKLADKQRRTKTLLQRTTKNAMIEAVIFMEKELGEMDAVISLGLERLEEKWKEEQFGKAAM